MSAQRTDALRQAASRGHWHVSTLLGASRRSRLDASHVVDGNLVVASVGQKLDPVHKLGNVVVIESLGSHKVGGCKAIDDKAAMLLYLPSSSRDLNPIEVAAARLKSLLRAKAQRSVDGL